MKKSQSQLQATLTESLRANLSGLSEKHGKKLQKTVASAAKKIARKFTKLLTKERRAGKAVAEKTAPPSLRRATARRVAKPATRSAKPKKASAAASS